MSVAERTSVIVVSYGSIDLVADSLSQTELEPGTSVTVVDNFTTESERARARDLSARHGWQLVEPEHNLGFGGGVNAGVAHARARGANVFVLLNPDAYIREDGVAELASRAASAPLTLISPLVSRPDGGHFASLMELDLDTGHIRRMISGRQFANSTQWLSGACLALSVELWDRTGGFDDDYFLYWEDIDLSRRVLDTGGSLSFASDIVAVHSPGGTQQEKPQGKSAVYYFYNTRNRMVYAAKHLAPRDQWRWACRTIPAMRSILLRGGRRQFLRPDRTLWPALRGTVAGLWFVIRPRRAKHTS